MVQIRQLYFIGYNDGNNVSRPLCIKLPQMIGYLKCFKNENDDGNNNSSNNNNNNNSSRPGNTGLMSS